jgi:hypothetical protein
MLDQIKSLFTLIFALSFMYLLLDCDFKNKKRLYFIIPIVVVTVIIDAYVMLNYGYPRFMQLYPIIIQIPSLIVFTYASKFKIIKVLFVHLTLIALTTSVSVVAIIISGVVNPEKDVINVITCILYPLVAFVSYKYLRPTFLYMLRNAEKGWLSFCMIPITFNIIIYTYSKYSFSSTSITPKTILFASLNLLLSLSAYYLIFRNFRQTREQLTLQNEQDLLRTQISAAQVHLKSLKESQEKTIIYRHDMRHHLNLISAFLADNNIAATQKYIAEVQTTISGTVVDEYCNNYAVNLILYSYLTKAKNDQITVETQINLPENNRISDMDLCVIFSNALENAINACLHITDTKERILNIICMNKNDKLFIQITNSYQGVLEFIDDMPVTTEENHGLGTKSIAAVVQKYHGVCSFSADDKMFQSVVIL